VSSSSADIARRLEALVAMGLERASAPPTATEVVRLDRKTARLSSMRAAMGTRVRLTGLAGSPERLEEAAGRAFEEMDRLVALLTRFETASPVSVLNAAGRLDAPPPEVARVVAIALTFHALSRGAFDVSVAPLLALFESRLGGPGAAPPSDADIREALERVGARHVTASRRRIAFARPGMAVTLDGIAKGYVVDAFAGELERRGVTRYLVDAGGDIRARGRKEGDAPWTVAVKDPAGRARFPDLVNLEGGAVATSGSYEVYYDEARAFHHIVDPRTGRSPVHSASVSVRAPSALAADALATSVFCMEPGAGMALVDRLPECACLIIDGQGRERRSRDWTRAAPSGVAPARGGQSDATPPHLEEVEA
jgi:thiamine biosynthesis lipoprotein